MTLATAKCTRCAANIEVDETKDAGICQYCGTEFVTEKVIVDNIPQHITIIGKDAFRGNNCIEKVIIPISVKRIDEYAFCSCEKLKTIDFSHALSIAAIGGLAFAFCKNLEEIDLPDTVSSIGGHAFDNCMNLKNVSVVVQH